MEIDPSLSIDALKGKTILELTNMVEDQKVKATVVILDSDQDEPSRSLLSYCGCEDN
jgi:hypothetical protein